MPSHCLKCGTENREKSKFCSKCGNTLPQKQNGETSDVKKILGGRYRIEKSLKSGGMGSIYKARHIKLDEICAIKEMIFTSTDPKQNQYAMKRFYEEAKLLARLRYPNLPVVTDYFDENNKYYIVMDFVDGDDLETILKNCGKPGLSETEVKKLAEEILSVLDYLHKQSPPVLYRDIKPSNIMIRNSDKKVMLIDFGIARTVQGNIYSGQTAVGTFGYAPIEQYRGQVEPRSDLYALGATMHYLLSGVEPTSCIQEPVRKLAPQISEEMEKIIQKALQEKPEDRFSSAEEMLSAIRKTTEKTPAAQSSHIPSEKISSHKRIKHSLKGRFSNRNLLKDKIKIEEIRTIINGWGNRESWFAKDFGKKIDVTQVILENAIIISAEVLYMERLVEEGTEPCSNEDEKKLIFQKPSYKSLDDFPVVSPPDSFTTKLEENHIFQNSRQVSKCSKCNGAGDIPCKECKGKGISTKTRKIKDSTSAIKESPKCRYCRGTGKATCDLCNGYKEIIKYLFFGTRYYPMYFTDIIYEGRLDKNTFKDSQKILLYEEEIFDRQKGKSFDSVKIKDIQDSSFKTQVNSLMEEVSAHYKDTEKMLKVPMKIKLTIEEIIIREVQFKDNTLWIYGTGTEKDKVLLENRPLLWATGNIIGEVRNIFRGKPPEPKKE